MPGETLGGCRGTAWVPASLCSLWVGQSLGSGAACGFALYAGPVLIDGQAEAVAPGRTHRCPKRRKSHQQRGDLRS